MVCRFVSDCPRILDAQIDAINKRDFAKEADGWTEMTKNVYTIADALADGIVKQFPKKF